MKKEKLEKNVKDLLADYEDERIDSQKKNKYWYPLSMATYGSEEITEALESLCQFRTTMWRKTEEFENSFAKYVGSKHAIMVNSGSSADLLLSHLLKDEVDDEKDTVIIPAVTWPTQIWSAINAGFKVKLADVDPETLNMDFESLRLAIDDKTAAIFLVHLMGNPCEISKINNIIAESGYDIKIIEDCCEALGARINDKHIGSFGLGAAYSTFFSHHITTMEGGIVTLNSDRLARRARILRAHGWIRDTNIGHNSDLDSRYTFVDIGFNLRPTELQGGFGIHQIKKLPAFNLQRDFLFNRFGEFIKTTDYINTPKVSGTPSWLGIPLMVSYDAPFDRKEIIEYLENNGVETRPIVAGNITKQPVMSKVKLYYDEPLCGADEVHQRGFYIGLSPMFSEEKIDKLINLVNKFLNARKK